jgi:hypothetical protein
MFGYTLIKKSELKKLQEESSKYLSLVSYGYWFSGFRPFYKVLEKFIKGEVGSHSVWEIREELARSLGTDRYGRPLNDPKIFIPDNAIVSDTVTYTSKLNKNSDNSIGLSEIAGASQRIGDKMRIFRPVNGSRPVGYEYEGEGEVIKVFRNFVNGHDYIVEIVKVKGWNSTIDDKK